MAVPKSPLSPGSSGTPMSSRRRNSDNNNRNSTLAMPQTKEALCAFIYHDTEGGGGGGIIGAGAAAAPEEEKKATDDLTTTSTVSSSSSGDGGDGGDPRSSSSLAMERVTSSVANATEEGWSRRLSSSSNNAGWMSSPRQDDDETNGEGIIQTRRAINNVPHLPVPSPGGGGNGWPTMPTLFALPDGASAAKDKKEEGGGGSKEEEAGAAALMCLASSSAVKKAVANLERMNSSSSMMERRSCSSPLTEIHRNGGAETMTFSTPTHHSRIAISASADAAEEEGSPTSPTLVPAAASPTVGTPPPRRGEGGNRETVGAARSHHAIPSSPAPGGGSGSSRSVVTPVKAETPPRRCATPPTTLVPASPPGSWSRHSGATSAIAAATDVPATPESHRSTSSTAPRWPPPQSPAACHDKRLILVSGGGGDGGCPATTTPRTPELTRSRPSLSPCAGFFGAGSPTTTTPASPRCSLTIDRDAIEKDLDVVRSSIRKRPEDIQKVLKVAASLGNTAPWPILRLFVEEEEDGKGGSSSGGTTRDADPQSSSSSSSSYKEVMAQKALEACVRCEMIVNGEEEDGEEQALRFQDGRSQKAALTMVPAEARDAFHLDIGRRAMLGLNPRELDRHVFLVADQLCRGLTLLETPEEKRDVAKLLLRAGKEASRKAGGFSGGPDLLSKAETYLHGAMSILQCRKKNKVVWRDHYALVLGLYETLAEVEYGLGNHERVDMLVSRVCQNARNVGDTVPSCHVRLLSMAHGRRKPLEACIFGFDVLEDLGFHLPRKTTCFSAWKEVFRVYCKIRKRSDDDVLAIPSKKDTKMIHAETMLNATLGAAHSGAPEMVPLLVCRSMTISVKEGMSDSSGVAFSLFGGLLCALGCTKAGQRYGQLGISLLDKHDQSTKYKTRAMFIVQGAIRPFCVRLHDTLEPMLLNCGQARDLGLTDMAAYSIVGYLKTSFYCGTNCSQLLKKMDRYHEEFRACGCEMATTAIATIRRCVLNLMGEQCDKAAVLKLDMEGRNMTSAFWEYMYDFLAMVLAYLFHDYPRAYTLSCRCKERKSWSPDTFDTSICTFFQGLVLLEMVRRNPKSKSCYGSKARQCMVMVKQWATRCPENFLHKLRLLEAERASAYGKTRLARDAYEAAAELANSMGFVNDEAMACERAGIFFLRVGDSVQASNYLLRARDGYESMGASAKVKHMESVFGKSMRPR